MATPQIVQRQLAEAEAAARGTPAPQTELVTDPAQLEAPAPQAAPAPTPVEPTPAPAPEARPGKVEDFEQKFRSLQGIFNKTVPALQAENKALEGRLVQLQEQMQALVKATKKAADAPADDRDAKTFGDDTVAMVQRQAANVFGEMREQFETVMAQVNQRLADLESKVAGVGERTEKTLEEMFYTTLTDQVPNWRTINRDEQWLAWLDEVDPVYGVPRDHALQAAHKQLDAQRVVAIFKQFEAEKARRAPPSLESQVSPSGAGSAPAPTAPAPRKILSQKAIAKFYDDWAKGRYVGREEEAARLEQEINQAVAEGRVV